MEILPKLDSLEAIAKFDFYGEAEKHINAEKIPNGDKIAKAIIDSEAAELREQAVLNFLKTKKGALDFQADLSDLLGLYTRVSVHREALRIKQKISSEACNQLANQESVISAITAMQLMEAISTASEMEKGLTLYEEARTKLALLQGKTLNEAIGIFITMVSAQPDFIVKISASLKEADACFASCVRCGKFPPQNQVAAAARIIYGPNWEPETSKMYYLLALDCASG